ncbi:helix-turn-helix domain-containing protein [Emticicia agri]|uniref:AraC family transcriptional regulator n=1 Tax=Emticicia agri TaxID=2492393 RepID=A0A4Q5M5N0_9BACT|nr:helix-turn-helix transcriptional regulator [Emticicia agri]RYU97167.1 AraC family transcriptional regulator [Emticicia agri]
MNKTETIRDFYQIKVNSIPDNLDKEIGHFNVFKLEDFLPQYSREIPYSRKDFFKISLIIGKNRANYADKTIEIDKQAILFANPQIPYNWEYLGEEQSGYFCVFTEAFFNQFGKIKDYPVFKPGGNPIYFLSDEDLVRVKGIFLRIMDEIKTDYLYKYDLIRALVIELIHTAQKMQPATVVQSNHNAHTRISAIFLELLERQFPIESLQQQVNFRAPVDYANQLSLHVNYLNRVIKETTGKTTSQVIGERIAQEAKTLLKHSDWNIAEIGYSLGFEEPPHFINFFKKYTQISPKSFRAAQVV